MKILFFLFFSLLQTNSYLKYMIIRQKINNTNYTKINFTDQDMKRGIETLFY